MPLKYLRLWLAPWVFTAPMLHIDILSIESFGPGL